MRRRAARVQPPRAAARRDAAGGPFARTSARYPSAQCWRASSTVPSTSAMLAPRSCRATPLRPERVQLGEDPLAEDVPGLRECEGDVRVEALEPLGPGRAADPEV